MYLQKKLREEKRRDIERGVRMKGRRDVGREREKEIEVKSEGRETQYHKQVSNSA